MKYTLNLATRSYVNRRTLYMSYAAIGALLLVIMLFGLMRFAALYSDISQTEVKIKTIESNIVKRSGTGAAEFDEASYRNLLAHIEEANSLLRRDSFRWTDLLNRLEKVVPWQVRILQINPNHDDRLVKISGQAKTLQSLKKLIDNLITSGHYTHVLLERQATDSKTDWINFSIRLEGAF